MSIIFRWVINALALLLIAYLVPGFVVLSFYNALIATLILGLVNALIRPLLLVITFPITIMTLGLFIFVINALMVWLVSTIVKGFDISGFVPAIIVAFFMWLVSLGTNWLIKQAKES